MTDGKPPREDYRNKTWLYREYVGHGRSMRDIAEQFGLHVSSIDYWLTAYRIPKRPRGGTIAKAREAYQAYRKGVPRP